MSSPPVRQATLLAISGPLTGMRTPLADETKLGRAETNDIVLPDALASREHARVLRQNLGWLIEDLGSRHGTLLNEQPLKGRRSLLPNDEIRIGQSRFLFDSDFDIQNADFSDRSVFLASPSEETMEVPPVAVLSATATDSPSVRTGEEMDFIVELGELFESARVPFAEALQHACERVGRIFHAETLVLMLWDSAAGQLRSAVALSPEGHVLADASILRRVAGEKKAVLVSDRPEMPRHPAPDAPSAPAARSVLCAPLLADANLIGVLYLQRRELDAYSLVDLRNARAVARLLGVFVEARQRAEALERRLRFSLSEGELIAESPSMRRILKLLVRVAPTPSAVLLTGETGTGKEMLAREIHRASGRSGPFAALNCAAIPETLFESQLFGHEKGAFTGADRMQQGHIEQASGGTLFLDEIGELSPAMQPKLLRFLQERVFMRVGGTRNIRSDARLICATNRDLEAEVRAGRFREDLYHRIAVLPVELSPLRERREDIAALAALFTAQHARAIGKPEVSLSAEAARTLEGCPWPGNVRELSNCIERAVLLCDAPVLLPAHFDLRPPSAQGRVEVDASPGATAESLRPMAEVEREHIARVLSACEGNQVRAAELLGIHRNTLRKKIQEFGLK